tara:strand:- start:338 stop:1405 length:1068 start_codon:yes stop_codon:yes gene_type:complete
MKNLIITAAGLSSRFEGLKPKWMLTHPSGNWMLVESLNKLNFDDIDNIYFGFLKEHLEEYNCLDGIRLCIEELGITDKAEIVVLPERTKNQPHTVYSIIKSASIEGQIIIKEIDNTFTYPIQDGNYMCYYDLNLVDSINPSNKSYIEIGENGLISSIVEKQVISSTFGCGSYSFGSSEVFCDYFDKLSEEENLYLSHIIGYMINDGFEFLPVLVSEYVDWGTKEDWFSFVRNYRTLFVDLDGTLVESSGKYIPPYWGDTNAITENVNFLNSLYDTGKVYIIITTSRSSKGKWKSKTLQQLAKEKIKYHDIIFDLPHCSRTIINDYGSSNPYPTCDAVNIVRNSTELIRFVRDLGK